MEGSCENGLSIRLYCGTLARILEEQYEVKLTCVSRPVECPGGETEKQ